MEGDQHTGDPFDITGKRFSHYFVIRRIGAGGMGMVYEAEDQRLKRKVALKVLPPWSRFDENARKRFVREARAASSLSHPNICTVYEYDEVNDRPFLAMELIGGPSLQQLIAEGPLAPDRARMIVGQTASGLAHAHARGVVHRDIKPSNILVGSDDLIKIADFGLARIAGASTVTQSGSTLGTVAYMSPEQAQGAETGPATDIWSLGVVYYELLTARKPFQAEYPSAVVYLIVNEKPKGLQEITRQAGPEVTDLVTSCLAKEPDARPSASDLALEPHSGRAEEAGPVSHKEHRKRLIIGGGVVATFAILFALFLTMRSELGSVGPSRTSLVILPPVSEDSSGLNSLRGLIESSAREVSRVTKMARWDGEIAPFRDEAIGETIMTAADAGRVLGAKLAISTELLGDSSVALSLVSSEDLDTLGNEIVVLPPNDPVGSRNLIVLNMLQLLGVKTDQYTAPDDETEGVSPGAVDYYTQALGLLQQRTSAASVKGAIMLLERAVKESDDFAPAYAELGRAYLYRYEEIRDVDLLDEAERFCNRALELDENNETVYQILGRIQVEKGQYGFANRDFSRAIQKDSTNTEALLGMAQVLWKQRRLSEAEAMFRKAISSRKSYWPGYRQLALFYFFENRFKEAIAQFKIVAELAPLNPVGFRGIGASYFQLYEFEPAREYFQKALDIADDYTLYSNMGAVEFYLGNYSEAAGWFEKSLATDSTDYLVWGNLAMAYEYMPDERVRFREAALKTRELTEALLKVNPNDDFVKARLAGVDLQLGDTLSAMTILGDYSGAPDPHLTAATVFELATAWEAVGDRDRALQWLEEALKRDYPPTELYYYPGLSELREDPRFLEMIGSFPSDQEEPG